MKTQHQDFLLHIKRFLKQRRIEKNYDTLNALPYPAVELFYWQPEDGVNFGDELGRVIVELMLGRKGFTLSDEIPVPKRMISVGSILHYALNDTVVWGSGRNSHASDADHCFERLDVRAVRGPLTQAFLKSKGIVAPDVFGDPALLLPQLTHGRFKVTGELDVAFVPNLNDYQHYDFSKITIPVIDPRRSWNVVIQDLLRYRRILSSSLHGLIIAEAFGIPARYVRLVEHEGLFKYQDYYEGTGRAMPTACTSITQALDSSFDPAPKFDTEKLIASFPYDLWR